MSFWFQFHHILIDQFPLPVLHLVISVISQLNFADYQAEAKAEAEVISCWCAETAENLQTV